jgi:hypothetical protein
MRTLRGFDRGADLQYATMLIGIEAWRSGTVFTRLDWTT